MGGLAPGGQRGWKEITASAIDHAPRPAMTRRYSPQPRPLDLSRCLRLLQAHSSWASLPGRPTPLFTLRFRPRLAALEPPMMFAILFAV